MSKFDIPQKVEVQQILGMLLPDGVDVEESATVATDGGSKTMVAVYVDDENAPVSVCTCDFHFAAFAGGALTKIPKPGAEEAAETGEFSKMILDNLYEIMNICSRLFMNSHTPHLRLEKTYQTPDEVPSEVSQLFSEEHKAGFKISIEGYGEGQLSFIST